VKNMALYVVGGLVALLVVVGAGGGAAYLAVNKVLDGKVATAAGNNTNTSTGAVRDLHEGAELELKPFVTNLGDAGRASYINVTIHLVMSSEKDKVKVEKNVPIIRDAVLRVLNTKTSLEVTGPEGSNTLMQDVLKAANEALGGNYVQGVLITDKVVQY